MASKGRTAELRAIVAILHTRRMTLRANDDWLQNQDDAEPMMLSRRTLLMINVAAATFLLLVGLTPMLLTAIELLQGFLWLMHSNSGVAD